jgi:hypothetical protein
LAAGASLGAGTFADRTIRGSSRLLVEYPLEHYELYAYTQLILLMQNMQMGRVTVVELWVLSQIHAAILLLDHANNL